LPRKPSKRNAQTPVRESWKDSHFHSVIRDSKGRFISTARWHRPIKFESNARYLYVVKYGDVKKGKTLTITSDRKVFAPKHSWQRKQLTKAMLQKYASYDFESGRMILISTYDRVEGKKVWPR
jgi:hypothetical protein